MATVQHTQTKIRPDNPEKSNRDNVISVPQWPVDTAIATEGWFRWSKELAETSRVVSETGIDALVQYSGEIRDITSMWSKIVFGSLEEANLSVAEGNLSSSKLTNIVSEALKLSQRLQDANLQMLERQIKIASTAGRALSSMPSCILEPLHGAGA